MAREPLSVVIADPSRLGSRVLEQILAPLVYLIPCRDSAEVRAALADNPDLLLVTHNWPELDTLLADLARQRPDFRVLLLASPDTDPSRLASLCEQHGAGVLYRPFEPPQVLREVLHALASPPDSGEHETATPPPPEELAGPELLERDLAFCRRHRLSLSVIALRVDGHAALALELGEKTLRDMEWLLLDTLSGRLRREDSICFSRPGLIVLSLPGTPAPGARVLAHRLRRQLDEEGLEVRGFQVYPSLLAGIHCPPTTEAATPQQLIDGAVALSEQGLADSDQQAIVLSQAALDQLGLQQEPSGPAGPGDREDDDPETTEATAAEEEAPAEDTGQPDPETLWRSLEEILRSGEPNATSTRDGVLKRLVRVLGRLDENERMILVDELLMASTQWNEIE